MQLEKTQSYGSVQNAGKIANKLNAQANKNIWEVKRLVTDVSIVWYIKNTLTNQIHDYKK